MSERQGRIERKRRDFSLKALMMSNLRDRLMDGSLLILLAALLVLAAAY